MTPNAPPRWSEFASRRQPARRWLRRRASGSRLARRLGWLEYALLALIGLGIAITIVMALVDPSS